MNEEEIKCDICDTRYPSVAVLREHCWSLMHHIKIEHRKRNSVHTCTLCFESANSLTEYSKHLNSERHKTAVEEDKMNTSTNSDKQSQHEQHSQHWHQQQRSSYSPHSGQAPRQQKRSNFWDDIKSDESEPSYWDFNKYNYPINSDDFKNRNYDTYGQKISRNFAGSNYQYQSWHPGDKFARSDYQKNSTLFDYKHKKTIEHDNVHCGQRTSRKSQSQITKSLVSCRDKSRSPQTSNSRSHSGSPRLRNYSLLNSRGKSHKSQYFDSTVSGQDVSRNSLLHTRYSSATVSEKYFPSNETMPVSDKPVKEDKRSAEDILEKALTMVKVLREKRMLAKLEEEKQEKKRAEEEKQVPSEKSQNLDRVTLSESTSSHATKVTFTNTEKSKPVLVQKNNKLDLSKMINNPRSHRDRLKLEQMMRAHAVKSTRRFRVNENAADTNIQAFEIVEELSDDAILQIADVIGDEDKLEETDIKKASQPMENDEKLTSDVSKSTNKYVLNDSMIMDTDNILNTTSKSRSLDISNGCLTLGELTDVTIREDQTYFKGVISKTEKNLQQKLLWKRHNCISSIDAARLFQTWYKTKYDNNHNILKTGTKKELDNLLAEYYNSTDEYSLKSLGKLFAFRRSLQKYFLGRNIDTQKFKQSRKAFTNKTKELRIKARKKLRKVPTTSTKAVSKKASGHLGHPYNLSTEDNNLVTTSPVSQHSERRQCPETTMNNSHDSVAKKRKITENIAKKNMTSLSSKKAKQGISDIKMAKKNTTSQKEVVAGTSQVWDTWTLKTPSAHADIMSAVTNIDTSVEQEMKRNSNTSQNIASSIDKAITCLQTKPQSGIKNHCNHPKETQSKPKSGKEVKNIGNALHENTITSKYHEDTISQSVNVTSSRIPVDQDMTVEYNVSENSTSTATNRTSRSPQHVAVVSGIQVIESSNVSDKPHEGNFASANPRKRILKKPVEKCSFVNQLLDISLKEENVRAELGKIDEHMIQLSILMQRTQEEMQKYQDKKISLLTQEEKLRTQRIAMLQEASTSDLSRTAIPDSTKVTQATTTDSENTKTVQATNSISKNTQERISIAEDVSELSLLELIGDNINLAEKSKKETVDKENMESNNNKAHYTAPHKTYDLSIVKQEPDIDADIQSANNSINNCSCNAAVANGNQPDARQNIFTLEENVGMSRQKVTDSFISSTSAETKKDGLHISYVGTFEGEKDGEMLKKLAVNFADLKHASYAFLSEEEFRTLSDSETSPSIRNSLSSRRSLSKQLDRSCKNNNDNSLFKMPAVPDNDPCTSANSSLVSVSSLQCGSASSIDSGVAMEKMDYTVKLEPIDMEIQQKLISSSVESLSSSTQCGTSNRCKKKTSVYYPDPDSPSRKKLRKKRDRTPVSKLVDSSSDGSEAELSKVKRLKKKNPAAKKLTSWLAEDSDDVELEGIDELTPRTRARRDTTGFNIKMEDKVTPLIGSFSENHSKAVIALTYYKGFLYTCSQDLTAKKFYSPTGDCVMTFKGHKKPPSCLILTETVKDGVTLFTAGRDKTLILFNAKTGTKIFSMTFADEVKCIHEQWSKVYIGLLNGNVMCFNIKLKKCVDGFKCSEQEICSIGAAKEGTRRLLVIASTDSISIRDANSGLLLRSLQGVSHGPNKMLVRENLLYSCMDADKMVQCHDINTGQLLRKIKIPGGVITDIDCASQTLYTASLDGIVYCLDLKANNCFVQCLYGAGHELLTCLTVFNDVVFTGNKKGIVEAAKYDCQAHYQCQFGSCSTVFCNKDDLVDHCISTHILAQKTVIRCLWKNCSEWVEIKGDKNRARDHLSKHVKDL